MIKKLVCFLIGIAFLICYMPIAFAASFPSVQTDKSESRLYETVSFSITTSAEVNALQIVVDGKSGKTFTIYTQKDNFRYWEINIQFTRPGKRLVQFVALTSSGSKTVIPQNNLYINVKNDYEAIAPSTAFLTGKPIYFTLYTPSNAYSIRYTIDGYAFPKTASYYKKTGRQKTWQIPVTFSKAGSANIFFTAYNAKGTKLMIFPSTAISLTVQEGMPAITSLITDDSKIAPLIEGNPQFRVGVGNQMQLSLKVFDSEDKEIAVLASDLNAEDVKTYTWDVIDEANKQLTSPLGDYKLKLYANNSAGTTEKELSFSLVSADSPQVETVQPFVVAFDMALLKGTVQFDGNTSITEAGFYYGFSQDDLFKTAKYGKPTVGKNYSMLQTGLIPGATYYYCAYAKNAAGLEYKGDVLSFVTPAQSTFSIEDSFFDKVSDEYQYIFNSTKTKYTISDPPIGYNGSLQAALHIQKFTVPVWKLVKGKYVTSTVTLKVNRKLASAVKAIFADIYALKKKFPIKYVSSFYYRRIKGVNSSSTLSKHSYGCAIDINAPYNPHVISGDPRSESSPYTIRRDVANIFNKYGWSWGGDWSSSKDYMHFEYLGSPVAGKPAVEDSLTPATS
jgi:hypothetical protein